MRNASLFLLACMAGSLPSTAAAFGERWVPYDPNRGRDAGSVPFTGESAQPDAGHCYRQRKREFSGDCQKRPVGQSCGRPYSGKGCPGLLEYYPFEVDYRTADFTSDLYEGDPDVFATFDFPAAYDDYGEIESSPDALADPVNTRYVSGLRCQITPCEVSADDEEYSDCGGLEAGQSFCITPSVYSYAMYAYDVYYYQRMSTGRRSDGTLYEVPASTHPDVGDEACWYYDVRRFVRRHSVGVLVTTRKIPNDKFNPPLVSVNCFCGSDDAECQPDDEEPNCLPEPETPDGLGR